MTFLVLGIKFHNQGPTASLSCLNNEAAGSGEELYVASPGAFAGIELLGTETACAIGCNAVGGIRATDGIIVCEGAIQVLVHIGCVRRAGDAIGEVYFIAGGCLGIGKLATFVAAAAGPYNGLAIGDAVT